MPYRPINLQTCAWCYHENTNEYDNKHMIKISD